MSYRIGSFNLYKLNFEADKEKKKDFEKIANIIRDNQIDILAIQEAFARDAVEQIVKYLGSYYTFSWDQPKRKGASSQQLEGYAFIWDTRRIRLARKKEKNTNKIIDAIPQIFTGYNASIGKSIKNEFGQRIKHPRLARDPYYGRFAPIGLPRVEFRIINTHIMFSKNKKIDESEKENNLEKKDIQYRINEFQMLAKSIYNKIANSPQDNKVFYTVIAGDYNLCLYEYPKLTCNEIKLENMSLVTVQHKKTSLKTPPSAENNPKKLQEFKEKIKTLEDCYAHNYDHFSYAKEKFEGVNVSYDRVESLKNHTKSAEHFGKLQEHRKTISDHVPIYFDIELNPNTGMILSYNQTTGGEKCLEQKKN